MNSPGHAARTRRIGWTAYLLGILAVSGASGWLFLKSTRQPGPDPLPLYGTIPAFQLTNQLGQTITRANLHGEVWVSDLIFTRCAGPCPRLSRAMNRLQAALAGKGRVKLISLTADPGYDTPSVLKRYAQQFDAQPARWWFLTGDADQIQGLATGGLKLTRFEPPGSERQAGEDLLIHSTKIVLVDSRSRVRAYYDGTALNEDHILRDINLLLAVD